MSAITAVVTVKAAIKSHRCNWCSERIDAGESYKRWRYFAHGDASTCKLHPECYKAMKAEIMRTGDFEFDDDNPRGASN